jgi:predicted RNA-binding Zn ribbon-like protein
MNFLCIDFINSSWYINHRLYKDPLLDNELLLKLSEKWGIKPVTSPNKQEVNAIVELRTDLTKLARKLVDKIPLEESDIELINNYMSRTTYNKTLTSNNGSLLLQDMPIYKNWSWFISEVAASFASLLSSSSVTALKVCQNPECGWFFIDTSKSGTKKWCDDTCASLMKVRRFRQKQKDGKI